jgi:dTDP-4-amino-4,6-dideoxygalactose transaminase
LPDEAVEAALQAAYRDGDWGRYEGRYVARLEARLAEYHGIEFARTCASGTIAVEMALHALKIGPGDEVILAAYDYPGNFLSVHAVGARPVLVDVAGENWTLVPALLEQAVGPATRAVLVSHLHGGLAPMPAIVDFAAAKGLRVIEDAAQAPGATVYGRKAGTWGDVGILSFGGSKLLTAGRGGAILSRQADAIHRARVWSFRGNHICPLSELQAAVLLPQLDRLDARNAQRAERVRQLYQLLADVPGLAPLRKPPDAGQPAYYKLGWQFDEERFGLARRRFVAALRAEGIAFDEGFRALHLGRSPQRYRQGSSLQESERAHHGCVVLHHPVLLGTEEDAAQVAEAVRKAAHYADQLSLGSESSGTGRPF